MAAIPSCEELAREFVKKHANDRITAFPLQELLSSMLQTERDRVPLRVTATDIPWHDCSKWKPEKWYPMPIGFMARDQKEYIIDGYLIYKQDPEGPQDMLCLTGEPMTFVNALAVCEDFNEEKLL